MNIKKLIKFSNQCAGFGVDKLDTSETCQDCYKNNHELYEACCDYEKECKEIEMLL